MSETNILEVLEHIFKYSVNLAEGTILNKEKLVAKLQQHGFSKQSLDKAFDWLGELIKQQFNEISPSIENAMRIFTPEENSKLSIRCRSTILTLEKTAILDIKTREIVIHQLMQINKETIDIDELKWVVTIVLLSIPNSHDLIEKISKLNLILSAKKHEC